MWRGKLLLQAEDRAHHQHDTGDPGKHERQRVLAQEEIEGATQVDLHVVDHPFGNLLQRLRQRTMPAHGLVAMEVQEDAQNGQGAQDDHPPVVHAQCKCQKRQQGQGDHPIGHAAQCHDATRRRSGKPAPPVAVRLAGPVQEIEGHERQELGQHELTLESPDHVVVLDPGKQPDRQENGKGCPPASGSLTPDEEE